MDGTTIEARVLDLKRRVDEVLGAAAFIRYSIIAREQGEALSMRDLQLSRLRSAEPEVVRAAGDLEHEFFEYFNREGWRQDSVARGLADSMVKAYTAMMNLSISAGDELGTHGPFRKCLWRWFERLDALLGYHCIDRVKTAFPPKKEAGKEGNIHQNQVKTDRKKEFVQKVKGSEEYKGGYVFDHPTIPGVFSITYGSIEELVSKFLDDLCFQTENRHNWKQADRLFYFNNALITVSQLGEAYKRLRKNGKLE